MCSYCKHFPIQTPLLGVSERHHKKNYIGFFLLMHRSRLKPRLVSHPLRAPMTSKNSKRAYIQYNQILSPLSYCLYVYMNGSNIFDERRSFCSRTAAYINNIQSMAIRVCVYKIGPFYNVYTQDLRVNSSDEWFYDANWSYYFLYTQHNPIKLSPSYWNILILTEV